MSVESVTSLCLLGVRTVLSSLEVLPLVLAASRIEFSFRVGNFDSVSHSDLLIDPAPE